MKKMYYGAWHNFYHLNWPVRFLIEGVILLFAIFILYRFVKKLVQICWLRSYLVKGCVWLITELIYLIGKNSSWAVETDSKVIEWGEKNLMKVRK